VQFNCVKNWAECLWESLSELCSSLCEGRLERTVLKPALFPVKNCAVYSVLPSGMTSHSKISQFNWECVAPLTTVSVMRPCNLVEIYPKLYAPAWPSRYVGKTQRKQPKCGGSRYNTTCNVTNTAFFNTTLTVWKWGVIFHRNVGNAYFTSLPTLTFGHQFFWNVDKTTTNHVSIPFQIRSCIADVMGGWCASNSVAGGGGPRSSFLFKAWIHLFRLCFSCID